MTAMTAFGKILVVINVALSLLFLSWSAMVFTQSVDWGWKEPRKELGQKVPSELEKRKALSDSARKVIEERTNVAFLNAQKELDANELTFTTNHLEYVKELETLKTASG